MNLYDSFIPVVTCIIIAAYVIAIITAYSKRTDSYSVITATKLLKGLRKNIWIFIMLVILFPLSFFVLGAFYPKYPPVIDYVIYFFEIIFAMTMGNEILKYIYVKKHIVSCFS